jgi:hypothetical protein
MQAQQAPVSVQAYFSNKRSSSYDDPVGVAGTNTMIFNDYGKCGARGIKSWEKARFENYDQRAKQQKFYDEQRQLQQLKRKQEYEATKHIREAALKTQHEEEERARKLFEQKSDRIVVDYINEDANDAW